MATVRSLGLHEPSGLQYLIDESIIPPNSSNRGLYDWQVNIVEDHQYGQVEEEILTTDTCVLWSRGGILKRVFRLEQEGESIIQAVVTSFPLRDTGKDNVRPELSVPEGKKKRTNKDTAAFNPFLFSTPRHVEAGKEYERALVVVLKTQAHVFFLSGAVLVVNMPFETAMVFPAPRGLIFQRKVDPQVLEKSPSAPPNSLISSQLSGSAFQASNSHSLNVGFGSRPTLTVSPAQQASNHLFSGIEKQSHLPRVFSLIDPMSEMGLAVCTPNPPTSKNLRVNKVDVDLDLLDPAEEIVYVSSRDEWPQDPRKDNGAVPLILVVTFNRQTCAYTIWTAKFRNKESFLPAKKNQSYGTGASSRRRSSRAFGLGTGATTPVGRGPSGARESLDPGWGGPGLTVSKNSHRGGDHGEELASQLGPDFDDGAVNKTNRRVSSLLSRTELGGGNDRTTFSEMVTGSSGPHGHPRRGASLGHHNTRSSLGANHTQARRSSAFGDSSFLSAGNSFLDNPVDHLLEELNSGGDFDGFEQMNLSETIGGLPRELILSRVESFPSSTKTPVNSGSNARVRLPRAFTIASPFDTSQQADTVSISICIPETENAHLLAVNLVVQCHQTLHEDAHTARSSSSPESRTFVVRPIDMRQGPDILDACKLSDGDVSRMLILTRNPDGSSEVTLQAPWSTVMRVDLPPNFMVYNPFGLSPTSSPNRHRNTGLKRVISDISKSFAALQHPSKDGQVDMIDDKSKSHKIQIRMAPRSRHVRAILDVCDFVLCGAKHDREVLLVGWWRIMKWLNMRNEPEDDIEWTACIVLLFCLGVGFIEDQRTQAPVKQTKRKSKLLRSSSGSSVNLESWEAMLDQEGGSAGTTSNWMSGSAWKWATDQENPPSTTQTSPTAKSRSGRPNSTSNVKLPSTGQKNTFIIKCISLARECLSSADQEISSALPTTIGGDKMTRQTSLGALLIALHLYREEEKLNSNSCQDLHAKAGLLAPVLAQIATWLGWPSWGWHDPGYYRMETSDIDQWLFEDTKITSVPVPAEPFAPPSIFNFVESKLHRCDDSQFLTILDLATNISGSVQHPSPNPRLSQQMAALTPRTVAITGYLSQLHCLTSATEKVEAMLAWGLTIEIVQSLPEGISVPFFESISECQADPPTSWNKNLLELINRDDLGMSMKDNGVRSAHPRSQMTMAHDAFRDFHSIGHALLEPESMTAFDASAEADRSSLTKLIFRDDRRFVEASKLVNQMRAPVAECRREPDWTDADLLEAQKELVQIVVVRTMAVSSGRGMIHYSARVPLLTEKLPIPGFSAQCIMRPSNVTFTAERNSFSEEKSAWAFFHAGASTGLAISKAAKGIDTSWVLYNKPAESTNRHAGFLLALGLNGHLKTLAKWVAFKYLTPKHTMTSIGLLLGLAVSYLGTMDALITRLLSVHVTRMLPQGAAELNLSPLTQTTGIMGIGLLYCNSQHRRMSELMLSEIENVDQEEVSPPQEILRDEGYRLAAGFALGFINLGKGKDLRGLHDMHLVERLLAIAIGTKNVNLVHILDRATAGAVVAVAIIFMKTHDKTLAAKIDIPDTVHQFDYVRPDVFLLRTVARHLIMWEDVSATFEWMQNCLPKPYRKRARLDKVRRLSSEDMPFFNVIGGLCFTLGLRYAGSGSEPVRDLLVYYLDQFTRVCKLPALNYDGKLARNSVRHCQDAVALSAASVMAGTGDLTVFRRLRALHGRFDADTSYGSHLATHMAIGALFLGGGTYTFGTSNIAIASLLCAFYPLFPTNVLDNRSHLQAFRHLWVMAAEPRCLVPRDVQTYRPISIPISISLRDGSVRSTTAPSLLPDLSSISNLKIVSPDHWPLTIDFASNPDHLPSFQQNQSIYVRRRAAYNTPGSSVFHSTLKARLDAGSMSNGTAGGIFSMPGIPAMLGSAARFPSEWIFELPVLESLDMAERALVMSSYVTVAGTFGAVGSTSSSSSSSSGTRFLRNTVVDMRLMLEKSCSTFESRTRLWQLRLLFAWADGQLDSEEREAGGERGERGEKRGLWLRREVVEELRWRIWCAGGGGSGGGG